MMPGVLSVIVGSCMIIMGVPENQDFGFLVVGVPLVGLGLPCSIAGTIVSNSGKHMIKNVVTEFNMNNNKIVSFNLSPTIMKSQSQSNLGLGVTFSMNFWNFCRPAGAKIGIVFCRQGFHYIPLPAYFSCVRTGLGGTSEPRRGDGMNRQVVLTPAEKIKILAKRKDGCYFNPSIKNFRKCKWIMPLSSFRVTSGVIEMTYFG